MFIIFVALLVFWHLWIYIVMCEFSAQIYSINLPYPKYFIWRIFRNILAIYNNNKGSWHWVVIMTEISYFLSSANHRHRNMIIKSLISYFASCISTPNDEKHLSFCTFIRFYGLLHVTSTLYWWFFLFIF